MNQVMGGNLRNSPSSVRGARKTNFAQIQHYFSATKKNIWDLLFFNRPSREPSRYNKKQRERRRRRVVPFAICWRSPLTSSRPFPPPAAASTVINPIRASCSGISHVTLISPLLTMSDGGVNGAAGGQHWVTRMRSEVRGKTGGVTQTRLR